MKQTSLKRQIINCTLCTIAGLGLLLSWYFTCFKLHTGFWMDLDAAVFGFFNSRLLPENNFSLFVAWTNVRIFDLVSFSCMAALFISFYLKADEKQKHQIFCVFAMLVLTALVLKQISNFVFPFDRVSPTRYYQNVNLLSEITDLPIKPKDGSGSSFPGDHGMVMLVFSFFMLRFFGIRAFLTGLVIFMVFSMPRIMGGAHWFTDVVVGSVSFTLIFVSWILFTPLSDKILKLVSKLIPEKK